MRILSALLFPLLPLSYALGINCRGSFYCKDQDIWWTPIQTYLDVALESVKPTGILTYGNDTMYYRNDNIMCRARVAFDEGTTCMFLAGDHVPKVGVPMRFIIERLAALRDHGCRICGGVPLSPSNDPEVYGWLIVNFVLSDRDCGLGNQCMIVTKEGHAQSN